MPPLRLKQYPIPAFMIIATVRGFLLNFGVYYATRAALGLQSFEWSPAILFITGFVTLFATVIAITKDLPDIEGDKKYGIEVRAPSFAPTPPLKCVQQTAEMHFRYVPPQTFATKLGVRRLALLSVGLLAADYCAAMWLTVNTVGLFKPMFMGYAHALLLCALLFQTWRLEIQEYSQRAVQGFYRFIWNLFYAEYLLLPLL